FRLQLKTAQGTLCGQLFIIKGVVRCMALVSLQNIGISFGGPQLLEGADIFIERGERVCLIGRNGTGKSTLMKIIGGEIKPDYGKIVYQQGVRITLLSQEVPRDVQGSVLDIVSSAFGAQGKLLAEYHHASINLANDHSEKALVALENIQHKLESADAWQIQQRVETTLSLLNLQADDEFSKLSGGLKRRVLLAKALACEPDLLLLDEPTNHLDIDAIAWLEKFLVGFSGTLLFITHDRMLLQKLATRIIDLDRGNLTSWPGNYELYLERKQAALDAEAVESAKFDRKLAAEEVWVRQGVRARRTRNEGRVRALKELRKIRGQRREVTGAARMQMQEMERTGKLVFEAKNVSFGYDNRPVVRDFSTTIIRGDKVGFMGPNGLGKTTLLKLLLGYLKPQRGTVRHGTNIEVAYLDQHRIHLEDEKSVQDNVANGSDYVTINGNRRHVIGYLQDFLFLPERARSPVKVLSGGERNRLLLAKLFTKPSNVLVLDEPTNDLDIETLDLLEELLMDYIGTVLLVSHDRTFINNVVTSTLVFEGEGAVNEYVGGYDDWLRQERPKAGIIVQVKAEQEKVASRTKAEKIRKLTFKEKKELEEIPRYIEELEAEQEKIIQIMADPGFYRDRGSKVSEYTTRLEMLKKELAEAYARWEALEEAR
ncbi:MAG TPA: ATP-binding cassette domain-containing protein, partial [Nitrospirota bacterium]|nr:ATP-binding cassette domain-containing protein [Nitrospirota bacterium]